MIIDCIFKTIMWILVKLKIASEMKITSYKEGESRVWTSRISGTFSHPKKKI